MCNALSTAPDIWGLVIVSYHSSFYSPSKYTLSAWSVENTQLSIKWNSKQDCLCTHILWEVKLFTKGWDISVHIISHGADHLFFTSYNTRYGPDQCGSVGWASSHKAKGHRFDSQSGHMQGLWVRYPVGVLLRGNQSMFFSHIDVSLPLFLPPLLSL